MLRNYEVMFIIRPDMAEEEIDKVISTLESAVTSHQGKVAKVDKMGKRRLAYQVRKFNDGFYVLLTLEANGEAIHEVERRMRVTEPVIKFLTVRTDETEKRVSKIRAHRAAHPKRSTQQAAPAEPAAPAAAPAEAASAPEQATA
jgi:small subunit ribosomal protein S6